MRELLRLSYAIAATPWRICRDLFWPDDFDKAIREQAAELQRLADNNL